ncbi:MAG: hypothetical protein IKC65_10060 [Lentisphaeria bacterium]|nr:hypothetical protein [Lentisphaeria bacterium]
MAKFQTACPACGSAIHVYSEWAGRQAMCPLCRANITVPAEPSNSFFCPACGKEQPAGKPGYVTCAFCGESCLATPMLAFKCATPLPPAPDGIPRIACPYCERHYILSFTPVNGLIGCLDCMNIFACPPQPEKKQPQSGNAYTTMLLSPVPAQPKVQIAAAEQPRTETIVKTMQLSPQQQVNTTMPLSPVRNSIQTPEIAMKTMQLSPARNSIQTPEAAMKTMQLTPQPQINMPTQLPPAGNTADSPARKTVKLTLLPSAFQSGAAAAQPDKTIQLTPGSIPSSSRAEELLAQPANKPQYQTDHPFAASADAAFASLNAQQQPQEQKSGEGNSKLNNFLSRLRHPKNS